MPSTSDLLAGLHELRSKDRKHKVFGASSHKYALNPPTNEAALAGLEARWGFQFPEDFRSFLLQAGDGGAGPFYGIFPAGFYEANDEQYPWDNPQEFVVVRPGLPFVHTKAWNGLPGEDATEEAWRYYYAGCLEGAIPLCSQGCGLGVWLVVTGKERGHVWFDDLADGKGISPAKVPGCRRLTFSEWYARWIATSLNEVKPRKPR